MAAKINDAFRSKHFEVTAFYLLEIELQASFEASIEQQQVNARNAQTQTELI